MTCQTCPDIIMMTSPESETLSMVSSSQAATASVGARKIAQDEGDVDGCIVWRRILEAIEELTGVRRGDELLN